MNEQPETLKCVIKRLIAGGMAKYNARTVYEAAINALDVDYYSAVEVRDMFNAELRKAGKKTQVFDVCNDFSLSRLLAKCPRLARYAGYQHD